MDSPERAARARFARIAGGAPDAGMSYESFLADLAQRGLCARAGRELHACLDPTRVAGARGVSADGYAFVVRTLARHDTPACPLELCAVRNRSALRSARQLLAELAACDGHVQWLERALLGAVGDEAAHVPAEALLEGEPLARMRCLGLEPSALLRQPRAAEQRARVVIDGRAALTRAGSPQRGAGGSALSSRSSSCRALSEGGTARAALCARCGEAVPPEGRTALPHAATAPHLPALAATQQLECGEGAFLAEATQQLECGEGAFLAEATQQLECGEGAFLAAAGASPIPPPLMRVRSELVGGEQLSVGLRPHAELTTAARWRGPLAPARGSVPFELAHALLSRAHALAAELAAGRPTVLDAPPAACSLVARLAGAMRLPPLAAPAPTDPSRALLWLVGAPDAPAACASIRALCGACAAVLAAQPPVVRARAPAKVVGACCGRLSSLLLLLHAHGFPTSRGPGGDIELCSYVFSGGFSSGGPHPLEAALLLLCLKVAFPSRAFVLAGAAELGRTSGAEPPGLSEACRAALGGARLGDAAHEALRAALGWLPLCALVGGGCAVLAGGPGDGSWRLSELEAQADAARPLVRGAHLPAALLQALCSEPAEAARDGGCARAAPAFDGDATAAWCEREGVGLLVRGCERVPRGFCVAHGGRLISLCSARDLGAPGIARNDGALLLLAEDDEGCLRVRAKVLASAAEGAGAEHEHERAAL